MNKFKNSRVVSGLSPFEKWMVRSNLQYVAAEGLAVVVARLQARGYGRVAEGVNQAVKGGAL